MGNGLNGNVMITIIISTLPTTTTTTTILQLSDFVREYMGEPVPER